MRILGFIGADLVGGKEHEEGGIGPFLKERVKEEEHDALYVLERIARVLQRMNIDDVTNLWIGESAVVELEPDQAVGVADALGAANQGEGYEPFAGINLSLSLEDGQLLHIMTISYAQAHDPEEAALEVLDSAHVLALEPREDETPDAHEARLGELFDRYDSLEDFAAPFLELEQPFVQRILDALGKELPLWEPEMSVEVDHEGLESVDDLYTHTLSTSSALPGLDL